MTDVFLIISGLIVGALGVFTFIFLYTWGFKQWNEDPLKKLQADKSEKNYWRSFGDAFKYIIGLVIFFIVMLIVGGC